MMTTINVYNQEELNAIGKDFNGEIHIRFGDKANPAIVSKNLPDALIVVKDHSVVEAGVIRTLNPVIILLLKFMSLLLWKQTIILALKQQET